MNGTCEAKNVTISHSKLHDAFPHILKGKCLFTLQLLDGCNLSKSSSSSHPCPDFYYTHLGQRHVRVIHYIQEIRQLPLTVLPTSTNYYMTKIKESLSLWNFSQILSAYSTVGNTDSQAIKTN